MKKQRIYHNINFIDILLLLIFPITLILLMFLPQTIHYSLVLQIHEPSWWQIFTSGFVHQNLQHLIGNIIGYLLFIIPTFLLMLQYKNLNRLYRTLFLTILTTPIITSLIIVWIYPKSIPGVSYSQGASGIIAALAGTMFMFFLYAMYIESNRKLSIRNFSTIAILTSAIMIIVLNYLFYNRSINNLILLLIVLTIFILMLRHMKKQTRIILKNIVKLSHTNKTKYNLTILVLLLFIFTPIMLFPSQLSKNGSTVDIFVHYVGLLYGITTSYFMLKWK